MSEEPKGDLQFDRAEFGDPLPAAPSCAVCGQAVWKVYYAVNGRVLCERCKTEVELHANQGSGAARFLRATVYGVGAGAVGAGIWYAVEAAGFRLGIIAIVVGFLVGGAVRKGSNARGGWRYQALAVFLTYASIVSTYVPEIVTALRKGAVDNDPQATAAPDGGSSLVAVGVSVAFIAAIAFAAPFLSGFQNLIGIVIIGIALYQAWKMNKKLAIEITGPHVVGSASPPVPLEPGRG